MKTILVKIFLFTNCVFAQNFSPGYYLVNTDAEFTILSGSISDFQQNEKGEYTLSKNETGQFTLTKLDLIYGLNEVVYAYDYHKEKYFCFDPIGRVVVFKGMNSLVPVSILTQTGIGLLKETVNFIDGSSLYSGSYIWLVGQNISNSTVIVELANKAQIEIPQSKVELTTSELRKSAESKTYKKILD